MRPTYTRALTILSVYVLVSGCGSAAFKQGLGRHHAGPEPDLSPKHHVLVSDTGFDLDNTVFAGKILARYTLKCKAGKKAATDSKEATIAALKEANESCSYVEGYTPHISDDFAGIAADRDGWNQMMRSKVTDLTWRRQVGSSRISKIWRIINRSDKSYNYHGTGTAGLIAYQNPHVRLVIVQRRLGIATSSSDAACPTTAKAMQDDIDLLSDADVQAAMVAQPPSSEERSFADLISKYDIDTVNESWGWEATETYLKAIRDRCSYSDAKELIPLAKTYFKLRGDITAKREQHLDELLPARSKALVIKSAGNDGYQIDAPADLNDCAQRSEHLLLIGGIDDSRSISKWYNDGVKVGGSNFGNCVDAYALGTEVMTATPHDFLSTHNGTSFSAPLFVRWLTQQVEPGRSPKDTVNILRGKLDGNRYVPADAVPEELAFERRELLMQSFSLVDAGSDAPTPLGGKPAVSLRPEDASVFP